MLAGSSLAKHPMLTMLQYSTKTASSAIEPALVRCRIGAPHDAPGADPVVDLGLEVPALDEGLGLEFVWEAIPPLGLVDPPLGNIRPEIVAPPADDEPGDHHVEVNPGNDDW